LAFCVLDLKKILEIGNIREQKFQEFEAFVGEMTKARQAKPLAVQI